MPKLTGRPTNRVLKALRRAGWELRNPPGKKHHVLEHTELPGIIVVSAPDDQKGHLRQYHKGGRAYTG